MNHRNNLIMREIMQEGGERRDRRLEKKKDRQIDPAPYPEAKI